MPRWETNGGFFSQIRRYGVKKGYDEKQVQCRNAVYLLLFAQMH